MNINYVKQYKDYLSEFQSNSEYYIIEINSKEFDEYWQRCSYLNEAFKHAADCKRLSKYSQILNEIKNNLNNEIAYPIIAWVDEKNIKISQGRHRIRAIVDSGAETIQLAIKKEYFKILEKQLNFNIVEKFIFNS